MRRHLMINLFCSKCSAPLIISENGEIKNSMKHGQQNDPTGADCRYTDVVLVEPCSHCIQKVTGPAKQLAAAIKVLTNEN